ncbi:MAG: UMP kinase [Candidatus Kerfeldbacteria bacterium]
MNNSALVISLGGSVVVPRDVDVRFVSRFATMIKRLSQKRRFAITCGGGAQSRTMVRIAKKLGARRDEDLHWIGIRQTVVNSELIRIALGVRRPVMTSYSEHTRFTGNIIVAAGRKPGGTTDYCAVVLARALGANSIINVTDVEGVYTADPDTSRHARLIDRMTWKEYRRVFDRPLKPSMHAPFDPAASRYAARHQLTVFVVSSNLANLRKVIAGKPFVGTTIGLS